MCVGRFTGENENQVEIALGCENGFVYILRDFTIHKWISVGHTINHLSSLNDENINSQTGMNNQNHNNSNGNYDMALDGLRASQSQLSLLICAGHFNALKIYNKSTVCVIHFISA